MHRSFPLRFVCPDDLVAVSRPTTELAWTRGTMQDANHSNAASNHYFTFGGRRATSDWAARFRKESPA
jgi:hypothetical protein